MTEQEQEQTSPWAFAPEYEARFKELPPSQRREALKRLTGRRRNPLTEEQCREVCPDVEQTLDAVHKAYLNKKQRSKQASAVKRMVQKANPDAEPETAEPEAEVEAVADAVGTLSVEPAEIVAESAPEPPAVQRSKPIPIPAPAKMPVARAPATPASMPALALPATPAKKKGLAGRFA